MKNKFKVGDKVRAIESVGPLITGHEYTVTDISKSGNCIYSDGFDGGWFQDRFELGEQPKLLDISVLNEKIQKAESMIGKKVRYKDTSAVGVASEYKVITDNKSFPKGYQSVSVLDEMKNTGYCVAVKYSGLASPVDDLAEDISKKFVLNKSYTAEIFLDKVVVGCQTIDSKVILEMAEYIKTL